MTQSKPHSDLKTPGRPISQLPLWAILTIPFVFLIVIVVASTNYSAHQNSRAVVEDIAEQLLHEINERIEAHLQSFLEISTLINQNNANLIRNNILHVNDQEALSQHFWEEVQVYKTITSIYLGNPDGGLALGGREGADGSLYLMRTDDFVSGALHKIATDNEGNETELLFTVDHFDTRTRPWYMGAIEQGGSNWEAPYVLSTGQDLAIASSLPVYDDKGNLLAVLSVDIFISHIQAFLSNLDVGETGQAYIIEHSGELVSTSSNTATFVREDDNWRRILAIESENPIISESARFIGDDNGRILREDQIQQIVSLNGQDHYLLVTHFTAIDALDWLIVIAIPQEDFLGAIEAQSRVTIILTIVALIMTTIVGTLISIQILSPITRLSLAASNLAKGNWLEQVPIEGVAEIRLLGEAFNKMSSQLYEVFTNLEERISERTSELSASEARYRAVVHDQTELICRFTPDYHLTFYNDAYRRYFSHAESDSGNSHFTSYILDEERPDVLEELARLSPALPTINIEYRVERFDKKVRWMQWIIRALFDNSDTIQEVQAVGRDITETKQFEERLQQALDREIELNQLKSQFVTTVSHEFRTPLTIILNSSEILERYNDQLDDDRKKQHYKKIFEQVKHMTSLLENVLTLERNERTSIKIQIAEHDLVTLCQGIIDEVQASSKNIITFKLTTSGDCNQAEVDSKLMRLIFMNLISNAAKYSSEDGIVEVTLRCNENGIQFIVKDYGIGIPQENQSNIFEPFYRAENSENINGTGLGLAITRHSVEQHGGTLSFVSKESVGTTFTVEIPKTNEDKS